MTRSARPRTNDAELAELTNAPRSAEQAREIEIDKRGVPSSRHRRERQHELNASLAALINETNRSGIRPRRGRQQADDLRTRLENVGAINMLALEELGETRSGTFFLRRSIRTSLTASLQTEEARAR